MNGGSESKVVFLISIWNWILSNQNFWPAQANNASWHHLLCTLDILDLMQFAQSNGFRLKPELNPYRLKPELNLCWVKSDGLNSGCAYYYIRTENNRRTEKNHTIGTEQNRNQNWNRNRKNLKTVDVASTETEEEKSMGASRRRSPFDWVRPCRRSRSAIPMEGIKHADSLLHNSEFRVRPADLVLLQYCLFVCFQALCLIIQHSTSTVLDDWKEADHSTSIFKTNIQWLNESQNKRIARI